MVQAAPSVGMPFADLLGLQVTTQEKDRITAKMLVRPELCTAGDTVHGGALMAFADSAGALATFINLPEGAKGTTTVESKTNFVRGAKAGETIVSVTTPVHIGRRTQVWQTRLETEDGKLIALVTQTQMVL
jgi:1,4-dihydroxy-2-naphthoyl-CoA hydrolase